MNKSRPSSPSGRPRGRPPAGRRAVSREDVVAAAARSLGRHGYRGTTLRGLADELGVSLGTVQHHIANKEAMWRAVVDEVVVTRLARATAAGVGAEDAEAALRAVLRTRLTDALSTPGLLAMTEGDGSTDAEGRLAYLKAATAPLRDRGLELLREAQRDGEVADVDPMLFLTVVNLGLVSVLSSGDALRAFFDVDLDDPAQREHLLDGLIDLILYGLLPR